MAPAGGLQLHPASAPDVPVPPGATVTYLWTVPPEAGPASGSSTTSRLWLYRSSTDPVAHDNAGLVGGIIVTPDKKAGPNYRPKDVDREIITVFQVRGLVVVVAVLWLPVFVNSIRAGWFNAPAGGSDTSRSLHP